MKKCVVLKPFDGYKVGDLIDVDEDDFVRWKRHGRVISAEKVRDDPEWQVRIEKAKGRPADSFSDSMRVRAAEIYSVMKATDNRLEQQKKVQDKATADYYSSLRSETTLAELPPSDDLTSEPSEKMKRRVLLTFVINEHEEREGRHIESRADLCRLLYEALHLMRDDAPDPKPKDPLEAVLEAIGYHRGRGRGDVEKIHLLVKKRAIEYEETLSQVLKNYGMAYEQFRKEQMGSEGS